MRSNSNKRLSFSETGYPKLYFVGFVRRAVTVSSNRETVFSYQSIKVKKKARKKENLHLHVIAVKRDEKTNQDSERKKR